MRFESVSSDRACFFITQVVHRGPCKKDHRRSVDVRVRLLLPLVHAGDDDDDSIRRRDGGRALHVQATKEPVSDVLHGGSGGVLPGSFAGHVCVVRAHRQGAVSECTIGRMPRCHDGPAQVSHGQLGGWISNAPCRRGRPIDSDEEQTFRAEIPLDVWKQVQNTGIYILY